MDWYKQWFGEEYLLVYEHRDTEEATNDILHIKQILNLKNNELVLDLCCGQGRHDVPLSQQGLHVIGLDYSMPMLKIAAGIKPRDAEYPLYVRGDALHIPFRACVFDAVLNLFTSFGYFNDAGNLRLLHSIFRILKPGGRYFIDYLNPVYVLNNLVEESVKDKDGKKIIEKRRHNHELKRIEKTITLKSQGRSQIFHESVRLYEPEEMLSMIADAGLKNTDILGSVHGEPYSGSSKRMVLHGIKE